LEEALDLPELGEAVGNTLVLAVASLVVALVVGVILAYCVSTLPPKMSAVATMIATVPMLIPSLGAGFGWIFAFSPDSGYLNQALRGLLGRDMATGGPVNVFTLWAIVLIPTMYLIPYVFLLTSTA